MTSYRISACYKVRLLGTGGKELVAPQASKPTQWRAFSSSGSPGFLLSLDLGVYDTGSFPLMSTSQASLSPSRGLCDAGSPDAFDTSGPSFHVLISRLPALPFSVLRRELEVAS